MRIGITLGVLVLGACVAGNELGQCVGNAIGDALEHAAEIQAAEAGKDPARPDEGFVTRTTTRFSVALAGGRLGLSFTGAPATGRIPRVDAGCEVLNYGYFLPPGWPDAGALETVTGLVTVASHEAQDGGSRWVLDATELSASRPDAGATLLPDRHVDVVTTTP
jgi:hypothetical protein